MPFNPPLPRPFGETSVRESAPAMSGVYGVSNAVEWVYIPAAGCLIYREPDARSWLRAASAALQAASFIAE